MVQVADDARLKKLLKEAVIEVLEERRDLLREAFSEAIEDIGMARAIEEGSHSPIVSRDEVFRVLRKRR